ncbi:adenylate/guanylate cyclase domain-containing protein [Allocoleopsis sp.]|uniref:CHASE2 domain-containing protein n=1 Tax=Allocoleopsis sp. TaxID=3088169 RepID=UPI002FCEA3C5
MRERLKRLLWDWRGVWITAPTIAGLVILLRMLGFLQPWEWAAYDQYSRLRATEPRDNRIVIVGIDEADIQSIGQPIIPDEVYARLLEKLKAMQPRAIGLDIYRDLPVEPGHEKLVQVFKSTPNLIGIQKVVGNNSREAVAPPPVLKDKGQVGSNDLILDADNKVRRDLLFVETAKGDTMATLGMYVALLYLEKENIQIKEIPGTTDWRLGKTTFDRFQSNDGGYIRADDGGYQVFLNYRGPSNHFTIVPMRDILNNKVPKEWGRDRIILIGGVSESFPDLYFTPYSSSLLSSPERMAGVEIHANIASQVLSAALEGRSLIKSWPESSEWLWILFWAAVGGVLSWQGRYTGGVTNFSIHRAFGPILAGGALVGSTYIAFLAGWWIPIIPPILALSGSTIVIMAYIAQTARGIRKTFGRYLTDEVVANLLEHPEGLKLGGERRKITILTSDLRGFTALSERLPPEEVIKVLNLYLGYMADVITQYQGTIDEFMGDGILVLFGAPTAREDDAQRAIACGIAMQLAMDCVNAKMKQLDLPQLEMGIGINTGDVVVGNIGSEKRTKYGVVGSQVNLTYRIESYTVGGQVLISESTFKEAGSIVEVEGQREVYTKGVKKPVTIYEVAGIGGAFNLFLRQQEEEFFPLAESINIQYAILDGKHVSAVMLKGRLVKLSAKGAEVSAQYPVVPLSNIKFNLLPLNTPDSASEDIYAKVIEREIDNGNFCIHFTSLPPDIESMLNNLYESSASVR